MDEEFELLRLYMVEFINRMKPVTVEHQISVFKEHGYIDYGCNKGEFPTFKQWKKIIKP